MKAESILANRIYESRKLMGVTQEVLAEKLGITPQSVSRWENGQSRPDVDMLPKLAAFFGTTIDALFGYQAENLKINRYEEKYKCTSNYYGSKIKRVTREILEVLPPTQPRTVLDIGCGIGEMAVFFARNGYIVSAFDIDEENLNIGKNLARSVGVDVNFFCADLLKYKIESKFDIIYAKDFLYHVPPQDRTRIFEMIQANTNVGGLNALNAYVEKSFLGEPPEWRNDKYFYQTAELFGYYGKNWRLEIIDEYYFDCNNGGVPHQHCVDVMLAKKISD